ncbi:MAG TPA: hypothetical protein EYN79_07200 [Planctomycetes bacterium]|nr:hypothetical protein [Planctomycetota bacterium]
MTDRHSHGAIFTRLSVVMLLLACTVTPVGAQTSCPEEPPVENSQGSGTTTCPCFVAGEEVGAVFEMPAAHYPIEVLRVGIGWGSQFGGAPQVFEQSIRIREGGLPTPGAIILELPGPVLTDGFINEFDLEPLPGEVIVDSGPFTVTLAFANSNAGMVFDPSIVHDGNGCIPGQNVVFAIPGGWFDACALGVSGDWLVQVVYRQLSCGPSAPEFIRGECNDDGSVNIADAIQLLAFLFPAGPPSTPTCLDACDANDDALLNIADAIALLAALFGNPAVPLPEPATCGVDPTADTLECSSFSACP